jgi:hypothetical protein
VLYPISVVESTEPKQVYSGKLGFVSERTIKDIIITKVTPFSPAKGVASCRHAFDHVF